MKRTLLAAAAVLSLGQVSAAEVIMFADKSTDKFGSQVCLLAASEGLASAKAYIKENGETFRSVSADLTCNGRSLSTFARMYSDLRDADAITVKDASEVAHLGE